MARVKAPNGDIYDLDPTVASGLVGSGEDWSYAESETAAPAVFATTAEVTVIPVSKVDSDGETTPAATAETADGTVVGDGVNVATLPVEKPAGNASTEAWAKYAGALGIDTVGLTQTKIREAVTAHEASQK